MSNPESGASSAPHPPSTAQERPGNVADVRISTPPPHNTAVALPQTPVAQTGSAAAKDQHVILGIAVVDFNHLVGPQVEYSYPQSLLQNEDLCKKLPFLALPDGSHQSGEDFCFFHFDCLSLHPTTIFGISCNRQITSDELINKGAHVTRSTVQKAVVVLATKAVFGAVRAKLGIVTRAFFAQRDLENLSLLEDFYDTLETSVAGHDDHALYMGTSIRSLVYEWRFRALVLFKLLLLQKKIMFFGYPVEKLCTYQYSLVSLVPGLLGALQDAALPSMDSGPRKKVESLRMSDKKSLLAYMGLPLPLFGRGAFFQPYCPLQQLDMLSADSWVIGTTNSIFKKHRSFKPDVIVDLGSGSLEFSDPALSSIVSLTPADRKWMDGLVASVQSTWNEALPSQPTLMQFEGSDDYLRGRFEEYLFGLLATSKEVMHGSDSAAAQFGGEFVGAFLRTPVFMQWDKSTDETLPGLIEARHPCNEPVSAVSDIALRVSAGIQDLRLDENLGPTREAIGAALSAGGAGIARIASSWRTDFNKIAGSWGSPKSSGRESQPESRDSSDSSTWSAAAQEQRNAALSNFSAFFGSGQRTLATSLRRQRGESA
ncbi:hypothetical protein MCUN1_002669 [Malassezia cuniculi]|uniref:UDENN domain-containing protein n=1 Tax=Malassezia cuniculi TaxID=948313 RepID=A0AAF0J6Q6_9BASI|nr:hypothetical protein MCUN1_002669 [Malassezia cuniculi]